MSAVESSVITNREHERNRADGNAFCEMERVTMTRCS